MAGWSWGTAWGDDALDEQEEEAEGRGYTSSKDCLVLLVDATKHMFHTSGENEDTPFELSLKCVKSVLLNKIVSSEKDLVGVVLYGTDGSQNKSDFKHIFVLQDLDAPDASRIKQIEDMLDADSIMKFPEKFGHSDDFSMSDVFWTCSNMLSDSGSKNSHKRIILFTNNDQPHRDNTSLQRQAKTKAKDLAENGVEIELMHIGRTFDVSLFYQDILFAGDDVTLPDPSERFEELLLRVRSKEVKKRTLQRIPFSLGPGLEIGVGVYCLAREAKKPSFVRLDQRSNEEVRTQTKQLCEDTGTELMPTDIKYYQLFGGEKVIFEKEEVTDMKKFGKPGFTLMGFKPRSRVKQYCYIKPANFIYPDENVVKGSSTLFKALLDRCLARDVVAVCRYIPRQNAQPFFTALVPQAEKFDDSNIQVTPPGFHVVFLPFAEDFRTLHLEEVSEASTEQIDKAKEIIKKLTFKYQPDAFENPVLQQHYRFLEAIALEHDEVEDFTDLTKPDCDRITRRAGQLLEEFKELVYPSDYDPEKKSTTKRKAASDGPSTKRTKKSTSEEVDVETEAKNGNLQKMTVPVLKAYLKKVGIKPEGKKQDLVETVKEHLGL